MRWQHPERGLILPAEFIPIATETGLSISMDWWVLAQACRQIRVWQEQFPDNLPLTISVNLCSQHFSQPNLISHIDQILQETGLDAQSLKMEITENVTVQGGRESRLKKAAGSGGRRFRTLGDSDPQCTGARSQEELKR